MMTEFKNFRFSFYYCQKLKDPSCNELKGEIIFSFNLLIEWLYLGDVNNEPKISAIIGFKLWKDDSSLSFYIQDDNIIL